MSRKIFLLRFCVGSLFCLCLPAICCAAQTSALPKTIGHLDSQQVLVFEGNKTYSKEQICTALYRDKDVIIAISPAASFENYLRVLESKICLGYLNDGFYSPKVQVVYHREPERIVVSITEGPRYTKGPLVIHGASEALENDLVRCLKNMDPRVVDATEISEIMKSISQGNMNAAMTKDVYMALLWGNSEPPSFAPSFVRTSTKYLDNLLRVLGYYSSEFTLNLVPDHAARSVCLDITFQTEGTRPHIGTIKLSGNEINSNEQVLNYLGLKTGQLLDDVVVQTAQSKLMKSGRFRFIEVKPEVNAADPNQSTLKITLKETRPAAPLDQKLSDKEVLMQKVGQFMDSYQSWEKDVCIRAEIPKTGTLADLLKSYGISISAIEVIYSSQKGILLSEMIDRTRALNTIILVPERMSYLSPPLNHYVLGSNLKGKAIVQLNVSPNPQNEDGWSIDMGMGLSSKNSAFEKTFSYRPEMNLHPAVWFHLANNPETEITFTDDKRALVKTQFYEIEVDRQTGEPIEIRTEESFHIMFRKGAFEEAIQKIKGDLIEHNYTSQSLDDEGVLVNLFLPLYLTHLPEDRFTPEQKIQAIHAWRQMFSGFAECGSFIDETQKVQEDNFPLPVDDQLANGGMMPMLMGILYQVCHDNLPRDSWVRTLSHASVLIASGYSQHPGLTQDLQELYNSDQIGPVGYLFTAQALKQLGFSAFGAFARRGLQTMSADDFRKDWKPLLTRDSRIKDGLLCRLEKFQTCNSQDIQRLTSIFPAEFAVLLESVAQRLRETDIKQLPESIDPILTEFWEKCLKEKIRQDLNELIKRQNESMRQTVLMTPVKNKELTIGKDSIQGKSVVPR